MDKKSAYSMAQLSFFAYLEIRTLFFKISVDYDSEV
jgi:hypothetical protein